LGYSGVPGWLAGWIDWLKLVGWLDGWLDKTSIQLSSYEASLVFDKIENNGPTSRGLSAIDFGYVRVPSSLGT
jgi:hypothetical protein